MHSRSSKPQHSGEDVEMKGGEVSELRSLGKINRTAARARIENRGSAAVGNLSVTRSYKRFLDSLLLLLALPCLALPLFAHVES